MKSIVIVVPTLLAGGMERSISELSSYFAATNIQVHIIFLVRHQPFYDIHEKVRLYFPPFGYREYFVSKFWFRLRLIFYQRKLLLRFNPDTVFSVPHGYSDLTILAALGTNIPVFVSVRNNPTKKMSLPRKLLRRILYPFAAGIVAQTSVAKDILKRYNKNIRIIHNSVKSFQTYPKIVESNVILNIGRLEKGKNQIELIHIFSRIKRIGWELWLVGDGPMRMELETYIKELQLQDMVFLKGQIKNIDEVMGQADIFAFTSLSEGFPNALLEAKAYPIPCIAFNCLAGPKDIIVDGVDGFLIEMGNSKEYQIKLETLMNDPELREKFKQGGRETKEKHSIAKIGAEYFKFLFGVNSD